MILKLYLTIFPFKFLKRKIGIGVSGKDVENVKTIHTIFIKEIFALFLFRFKN